MQSTVCEHVKTLTNVRWRPSLLRDGRRHGGELRAWRRGSRRLAGLHALRRITSPWIAAERLTYCKQRRYSPCADTAILATGLVMG
jgi:hypothetical protein